MARHENNHLKLSRKIDDPVAAIATNGSEVTASLRNDYLNEANKYIQLSVLAMSGGNWVDRRDLVARYIPGLVTEATITWSSGSASLPSDYRYWLECRDTGVGMLT